MISRIIHIKEFFTPPVFPGDEDKTRMAKVLNTLLLTSMLFLIFTGGILVPFVFVVKLYNGLFLLALFLVSAAAYWQMQRGHVRLASVMLVYGLWLAFTIYLFFAGGMTSIAAVFQVAGTVMAGLLLGTRAAITHTVACILAGLGMVILEISGHAPPRIFPIPPLVGWVDMTLGLLLTTTVISLVLRSLNDALSLARQEVKERKKAEEALREEKKFTDTALDSQIDTFFLFDPISGKALRWNKAFRDITGYTDEEIASMPVPSSYYGPEDLVRAQSLTKRILKEGAGSIELGLVCKDGRKVTTEYLVSVIYDDEGYAKYLISIGRDITERKRIEEERERLITQIRGQTRQMEQILTTVPAGVLLLDAGGRIIQANIVAKKALSVLTSDIRQPDLGQILTHLGDRPLAELLTSPPTKGLWHEVRTTAANADADAMAVKAPSGGRTFEVIARPVENGPEPESWVLVVNEVTQEREIRAKLQQQERLAAVGQLAAGIAHDFNNIMASIVLYAEMVARSQQLSERDRERMAVIVQQVQHATRLIQQILDFSRRSVLERRSLDLLPLLKEQVKLLERTLPEHIEIELVYRPDEADSINSYTVDADPTRMQQMLTNLALNARDAMPWGGTLRIELERITVEPGQSPILPEMVPGEWIQLTVSDTGTGIAPDVLPHIFEPFFTTKGPGGGSGLGMAQVYGIVGQHEGRISLETQVGEGTTFTIYLPALTTRAVERVLSEPPATSLGQGEVVLVVEDNAALRAALIEILDMLNYQPLEAVNGQEALTLMEKRGKQIALVLSDVVMPEMGGIALFHALREQERHSSQQTPVILLTGHPMDKELEALQAQGLSDWLLKPPSLEQLAQAMADALRP
jgi:PAS domain S-box-containing protein